MTEAATIPEAPIRVLVVDGDDRVRGSLCGLLSIGDRIRIVGSAGGAAVALERLVADRPDVVIVDPRLPELDGGAAFVDRLRAIDPGVRILAMGRADGPEQADLRDRADGFIRKTFRPTELIAAILAVGRRSSD